MRINFSITLILLLVLSFSCSSTKNVKQDNSEYFKIEIEQNGQIVNPENGVIQLTKSPFKFIVSMYKTDNVDVSSSWDKYYYDYPTNMDIYKCEDKVNFKNCRFVAIKTGNQSKYNSNEQLFVGDEDYQMNWFYRKTKDWHRFDKDVKVENDVICASMTIKNIYDCDKRDSGVEEKTEYDYSVDKISADIYLVFATRFYEKGMAHPRELQRQKIHLKFK